MAMRVNDLRTWRGTMGRGDFTKWGLLLFAFKYNLDRLIATMVFGDFWYPWSYLFGPPAGGRWIVDRQHTGVLLTILALSIPFIFWGVTMTLRRLRDADWPRACVVLFFVPFINLMFFALLCLQPASSQSPPSPGTPTRWQRLLEADNPFAAAALGIAASVLLGLSLTLFGTTFLQNYGWGLFVGTPFMMGFFGAMFYGAARVRTWPQCAAVALVSVLLVGGLLIALAFEGIICVLMAAPIALVLALLGATAGWYVQAETWSRRPSTVRLYTFAWIAAPLVLGLEARRPEPVPLVAVTSTCEIAAPPAVVWRHVIAFGELSPPSEKIFLAGIAYPIRARLEGRGVGAVRYCEFSTGPFVEPITAWDENQHLAFSVAAQPDPMREWSPYSEIRPAHLNGFFRSRRGEFRLTPLAGGRTRLEGTTWYEQSFWPQSYWRQWSDYLIHVIHERVLVHIKNEAERDPQASRLAPMASP